jgi:hypothetical protein
VDNGKSFIERYRSKNATPPHDETTASAAPRQRSKRLMGAPFEFVVEVCRSTQGRAALVVALYIYRRAIVCNSYTVTLPSDELTKLRIGRRDKNKALLRLQQAGLIVLVKVKGRTTQVTLKWQPPD